MFEYRYKGTTIEVDLPDKNGHEGYFISCTYKFIKSKQKYCISMYLMNKNTNGRYKICGQGVDTQLISSEKTEIESNIARIIEQAWQTDYFDDYMEDFEYTAQCFYAGDDLFSREESEENPDEATENV